MLRLTHSEPLFVKLGILTVDRLFKYNIGLLMYKFYHSMLPPVLDMFVKNYQIHSNNTRQSDRLHVPQCRTELGKMSFKYQAVMVWNHLYQSVDVSIGIGTFKRHVKSHLLSIISWIIIVSTVCVFPLYVFRIYWSTRHDLITGAPYAFFMHPYTCTLNWICVSVMGAYKHCCFSCVVLVLYTAKLIMAINLFSVLFYSREK